MTSPSHRRVLATMTGAVALLLLGAVGAWACTATADIALGASAGKPGATVAVEGSEFVNGGTVEVYWEPNEGERQLLFETTGSSFAQNLTIPANAPAGTHYVKAYGYDDENEVRGTATAAFTVPHGAVAGQVADEGGEPVHAAEVTVARNGTVVGSDTTNVEGHFRVEGLERGEHEIAVDRSNYQRSTANTNVDLGETSQLNFDLAREPQDEPESSGSDGSDGGDPEGSEGAEPEGSEAAEPQGSEVAEPEGSQGAEAPDGQAGEADNDASSEQGADAEEPADQPQAGETDEPQQPASSGQPGEPAASEPTRIDGSAPAQQPAEGTEEPASPRQPAEPVASEEQSAAADEADEVEAAEDEEPVEALATAAERRGRVPASESQFEPQASVPSARTGAADLWSGLEAGSEAAMADASAADSSGGPAGVGQQLAIAVGLLGVGLVLLAGGGVVAVRRRRITAPAERSSA